MAPPVKTPADASLPDVVVLTLDTTRADHLGVYGYFRDTSPTLDAFAGGALVFDRLIVPMATTLPTHTSLFTGTWPEEHGVLANVIHGGQRFVPSEQLVSFATVLRDSGYQTAGFVSAAPLKKKTGIESGFQVFTAPKRMERIGSETVDDALTWLGSTADTPILLWVHLYDPHNPFRAPPEYDARFKTTPEVEAWVAERQVSDLTKRPTGDIVRALPSINSYDAEIRYMDDQVARLLEGLSERGRLDDSLIVVMGDHGEGLNQHGQPGHGLVWSEQLHAPLMIRAPGITPGRVDTLLSAADVLPTALSLLELPVADAFLKQVTGVDVLGDDFSARPVLSQTSARQLEFGRPLTYALTGPTWKCTWQDDGVAELFQLTTDPHELTDLSEQEPERLAACTTELRSALEVQKARGTALGAGKTTDLTPAEVQALKALGYMDDDAEGVEED